MNSTRSTNRLRYRPLMTLATLLAMSSAANCFGGPPILSGPVKKVVGRGHLTGTEELQQVVTWQARTKLGGVKRDLAHLAIETVERTPRILWQADEPIPAIVI